MMSIFKRSITLLTLTSLSLTCILYAEDFNEYQTNEICEKHQDEGDATYACQASVIEALEETQLKKRTQEYLDIKSAFALQGQTKIKQADQEKLDKLEADQINGSIKSLNSEIKKLQAQENNDNPDAGLTEQQQLNIKRTQIKINKLQTSINRAQTTKEKNLLKIIDLRKQILRLLDSPKKGASSKEVLEKRIVTIREKISSEDSEVNPLKTQINELRGEIQKIKEKAGDNNPEAKFSALEYKNKTLSADHKRLNKQNEQLVDLLSQKDDKNEHTRVLAKNQRLETDIKKAFQQIKTLNEEYESDEEHIQAIGPIHQQLADSITLIEEQIATTTKNTNKRERELIALDTANRQLKKELKTLEDDHKGKLKATTAASEKEIETNNATIKSQEATIKQLGSDANNTQKYKEHLSELSSLDEKIKELRHEAKNNQLINSSNTKKREELAAKNITLETTTGQQEESIKKIEASNEQFENQVSKARIFELYNSELSFVGLLNKLVAQAKTLTSNSP